jgi:prepilin-type N-terminal cleavage/methylation domain-containing protein
MSKRSFTLIELVVASSILLIVVTGLLLSFVSCMLLNESNNNLVTAINDAQNVLEQLKEISYDSISSYTPVQVNNLPNESISLERSLGSSLGEVTIEVSWTERQRQRSYRLPTQFAR